MAEEKLESITTSFTHYKQLIYKLIKIEEKLGLLQDFNNKAELIRKARKELLETFIEMNKQIDMPETADSQKEKRVKFKPVHDDNDMSDTTITPTPSVQRSKSIDELVKHLHKWSMEVNIKKEEIDQLKLRKEDVTERGSGLDERIKKLEVEKEVLENEMLQLIFQNTFDNKEEYEHLVSQLENENCEMDRRLRLSEEKVARLKQINIALLTENQCLKESRENPLTSLSAMALLDKKIRKSIISGKRFSTITETYLSDLTDLDKVATSQSIQILLDLETEEKLSLDKVSQDSFQLDKPLATWGTDDYTLHDHVRRIANDCHEMQVTHMKLNMIKRYVRQHGTKDINRNTLIDPSGGMSQWK